jgi:hypothetical protein
MSRHTSKLPEIKIPAVYCDATECDGYPCDVPVETPGHSVCDKHYHRKYRRADIKKSKREKNQRKIKIK